MKLASSYIYVFLQLIYFAMMSKINLKHKILENLWTINYFLTKFCKDVYFTMGESKQQHNNMKRFYLLFKIQAMSKKCSIISKIWSIYLGKSLTYVEWLLWVWLIWTYIPVCTVPLALPRAFILFMRMSINVCSNKVLSFWNTAFNNLYFCLFAALSFLYIFLRYRK